MAIATIVFKVSTTLYMCASSIPAISKIGHRRIIANALPTPAAGCTTWTFREYSQRSPLAQADWTPVSVNEFQTPNHIKWQVCWESPGMRYADLGVILAYLALITWFGAHFRRNQQSPRAYVLGGRTAPWWAISLSIVSAETSTLTIVGTPALAFTGNLGFLQVVFGYLLARLVISAILLPHYFRGELFTAYELIERRFGGGVRRLTASMFLVTRALAEGVRVFAISRVAPVVLGTDEVWSIVLILLLTLVYTFEGGMTAVIWTDVVQMCLYVTGAVVSFFVILSHVPGGWSHVAAVAGSAGKFQLFDFGFAPTLAFFSKPYTFWAGLAGGGFFEVGS